MKIHQRGYWENDSVEGHLFDENLCKALITFMRKEKVVTVVDFGCGPGKYLKHFNECFKAEGFDGNPYTARLTHGMASVLDLSAHFRLQRTFDAVVCLEVGEHIPKAFEKIFVENLVRHADTYLVLSWAVKDQGGDGHVNCQSNAYIKALFSGYGFVALEQPEDYLRGYVSNRCPWFRNTLMVFKKNKPNTMNLIHQKIAHFLLINSEAVDTTKDPHGKMALLHFFFRYAHKYKKQHYADFAFELLQESLSEVIIRIQKNEDTDLGTIGIGHGLIRFVDNDFFDSDELDEILLPFDTIAIRETEHLSRGNFSSDNVRGLLSVAAYLLERMGHLDERLEHCFAIKEHLLIALFELIHHMDAWDTKDITWILSMGLLLEKCKNHQETAHLVKKGLQRLENGIMPDSRKILKLYASSKVDGDLDRALLLSLCFSAKVTGLAKDRRQLWNALESKIFHDMEQLYKRGNNALLSDMQSIIVYALALIERPEPKDLSFFTYAIAKQIQER